MLSLQFVPVEPMTSHVSTVNIYVCVFVFLKSGMIPINCCRQACGQDLEAMGRLARWHLLALTIEFNLEQLLGCNLFEKRKDRCFIYIRKFCI